MGAEVSSLCDLSDWGLESFHGQKFLPETADMPGCTFTDAKFVYDKYRSGKLKPVVKEGENPHEVYKHCLTLGLMSREEVKKIVAGFGIPHTSNDYDMKSDNSVFNKFNKDGAATQVKDICRTTIIKGRTDKTAGDLVKKLQELQADGKLIVTLKRPKPAMRHIKLYLRKGVDSIPAEVIIRTEASWKDYRSGKCERYHAAVQALSDEAKAKGLPCIELHGRGTGDLSGAMAGMKIGGGGAAAKPSSKK